MSGTQLSDEAVRVPAFVCLQLLFCGMARHNSDTASSPLVNKSSLVEGAFAEVLRQLACLTRDVLAADWLENALGILLAALALQDSYAERLSAFVQSSLLPALKVRFAPYLMIRSCLDSFLPSVAPSSSLRAGPVASLQVAARPGLYGQL